MLLQRMSTDCEPILLFSRCVMVVVSELGTHSEGDNKESYNCVLGWSCCHECPRESEIASRSDASMLLKLLWDDDKQFTKAMLWTYSPGLSSVMYLLWRYVIYERYLQAHPSPERFIIPFMDVFWRCVLSAPPDQFVAFSLINTFTFRHTLIWRNTPARPELADSRLLIQAGIDQLHLGTLPPYGLELLKENLLVDDIPGVLFFLHRHFTPGCEDLIPLLIGTTIRRFWMIFLEEKLGRDILLLSLTYSFGWFQGFIECLKEPTDKNEYIKEQTLLQVLDNDLISFIGCIILFLNPTPPLLQLSGEPERNEKFLRGCEKLFHLLGDLPSGNRLDEHFDSRNVGW
ncbi:unnamed protein product [Rhizoctonia solani]|uniref:Uncharacterized protein n=1 Tax=Rhizoctonia solani TaxID=456999 RepID=A0A8H3AD75_9AGAM|nr:unnamed protein product [Rhizoctonia solani]